MDRKHVQPELEEESRLEEAKIATLESVIRRVAGLSALASLAYVGHLLRHCPASGAICEPSGLLPVAIGLPLSVMVVGHLTSLVVGAIERRWLHRAQHA